MLTVANIFIVLLAIGAAWLGTAALVEKRTVRRRKDDAGRSNTAS